MTKKKIVLSLPNAVRWRIKEAAARRRLTMGAAFLAGLAALAAGRWRETRAPARPARGQATAGRATFLMTPAQYEAFRAFVARKKVTQREVAERVLQILESPGPL